MSLLEQVLKAREEAEQIDEWKKGKANGEDEGIVDESLIEDLKKARWYLDRLIQEQEGEGSDGEQKGES